jgi:rhodanese-related sulfurtransferase
MKKAKILDFVLFAVIAISVAIIGYKMFRTENFLFSVKSKGDVLEPVAEAPPTKTTAEIVRQRPPQWIFEKVLPVQLEQFREALTASPSKVNVVKRTSGCEKGWQPMQILSLVRPALVSRVESNELQFVFGLELPRCFEVGSALQVLYFPFQSAEPFVKLVGTVTVSDLAEFQPEDITQQLLDVFGITRAEYLGYAGHLRPKGLMDTLVRFDNFAKAAATDGQFPLGFPRSENVTKERVIELKRAFPTLVILDVREPSEFANGSIPGAENVPYTLPIGISASFSWNTLGGDISNAKFDLASILSRGHVPIVVVGASAKDARPLYVMAELLKAGYRQIYWLRDGVR